MPKLHSLPVLDIAVSKPAFLAAISYIIMAFTIIMPFNIGDGMPYSFGYRFLLLLIMLIPIVLSVYSVNCMFVGKCYLWSWVNAVAIAAWVLLFVLAVVLSSTRSAYQVGSISMQTVDEEPFATVNAPLWLDPSKAQPSRV